MAYTYLPSGYDINMGGAPAGGFTLGQLLMPNYLAGRPWEENSTGPVMLDPADIEGSFRAQTGYDLRGAIRDLAPGFPIPAGPITVDMLENVRVDPNTEQRAPAKDNGFETLLGAGAAAGIGYLSGGFGLGDLWSQFGGFGGDGITSTMASGANPTQVAGTSFFEGATPGLDLGPNNLWSGAYEYAGNPSLVADAVGTGSAPWWQGLPGTAGLEKLGTGAPYADVLNEGSGLWDTLTRGAKSLFGSGAASTAGSLFGTGGNTGGLFGSLFGTGGNTGGLFSSLFGNGGMGSFFDKAAASAPVLAAIQYARNQSPLDTGKLEGLYGSFDPNALAFGYDQNTVAGRESLTSGLTSRGVMGSSFGNNDITNFNTTRDLGRSALVNQGMGQRADIAKAIMDANFKSQQLKNNLYGSSLLALGNVFGGRSSPTLNFGGM